MTIQTWDPNRVGGGTIELVQDPTTGVFTTNEVGFVKLPDLNLPEITQADYATTSGDDDSDDSTTDPCPDGYSLVNGTCQPTGTPSDGGGGGGYEQDYTGQTAYDEALGKQQYWKEDEEWGPGPKSVVTQGPMGDKMWEPKPKQQLASSDRGPLDDPDKFGSYPLARQPSPEERFSSTFGEPVQKIEGGPVVQYNSQDMIDAYKDRESKIRRIANSRMSGVVKDKQIANILAQRPTPPTFDRFSDQETEVRNYPTQPFFDPYQTGPGVKGPIVTADQGFVDTIKTPVPFGTPTDIKQGFIGGKKVDDFLGRSKTMGGPAIVKDKILNTALKKLTNNEVTAKIKKDATKVKGKFISGLQIGGTIIGGVLDTLLGVTETDRRIQEINKSSLSSLGYKTRGELGSSIDPGRVALSPADSVFGGMNMVSAKGNIMAGSAKRIATRNSKKTRDRVAKRGEVALAKFDAKTRDFEIERNKVLNDQRQKQAKINRETMNQGGPAGGGGSKNGGKSIVCTAMYQTTGLQDWAKAMKIWYIYQKKYLTMQHQEGYHKLFKPFVKGMHKNKIIKAIGAHFAKHRTQHLKHIMFNSKPSLLGKIYNKILEPICYWAGKK